MVVSRQRSSETRKMGDLNTMGSRRARRVVDRAAKGETVKEAVRRSEPEA